MPGPVSPDMSMPTPPAAASEGKRVIPVLTGAREKSASAWNRIKSVPGAARVFAQEGLAGVGRNRYDKMTPEQQAAADRAKEVLQEKSLNSRVDVQVMGAERDELPAVARERVRQAQAELVRLQNADAQNTDSALKQLKPDERQKRLDALKAEARVVVLNNGNDVMLIQGDQRGYSVGPDGRLTLQTYSEPVVADDEQVMEEVNGVQQPKMIEHNGEVKLAKVSFESSTAQSPRGHSVEVPEVRMLRANAQGSAESIIRPVNETVARDGSRTQENVFRGVGDSMVDMKYSRIDVMGTDVYVVDVGRANVDSRVRALRAVADAMEGGRQTPGQEIVIAGAGADMLKVPGKRGGVLEVANITQRSQVETPANPNQPTNAERQVVDLVMSAEDASRFGQLSHDQQIALLRQQGGALPANFDANRLDFSITRAGAGDEPEGAVSLNPNIQRQLTLDAAHALATTQRILGGEMTQDQLRDITDPSQLLLIVGGRANFGNPLTAMNEANTFIGNLRETVDEQARRDGNILSRQQIARNFVNRFYPESLRAGNEAASQAFDRLVQEVGNRTDSEVFRDIRVAERPANTRPEDFDANLARTLVNDTEGLRGLDEQTALRVVEALRGEAGGLTTNEIFDQILQRRRDGTVKTDRATLQGMLDDARKRGLNVDDAQSFLNEVAGKPVTVEDVQAAIGKAAVEGNSAQVRDEVRAMIAQLPEGDERSALESRWNDLAPEAVAPELAEARAIARFSQFRLDHQGNTDADRMALASEVGRIVATLPDDQQAAVNTTLLGLIPQAQAQAPNYVAVMPQGVTALGNQQAAPNATNGTNPTA